MDHFSSSHNINCRYTFLGYIPHLNVPPQSIITAIISSSGTDVSKPLTTSAPVISAILSTISGLCPPVI